MFFSKLVVCEKAKKANQLTSIVYMGVEVTIYSGIYDDGVKASVAIGVPHLLTLPNGL
jgi:hypothetical protein